jgi:hypothetical protein
MSPKINGESLHLILSFSGSICPLLFSNVFSGCRRGRTPERSLRQPPSFDLEDRKPRPLPGGAFAVPVSSTDTRRLQVANELDVRLGWSPVVSSSLLRRWSRCHRTVTRYPHRGHVTGTGQVFSGTNEEHTGAGGPLPPRTPTRGGPADPHLPGFLPQWFRPRLAFDYSCQTMAGSSAEWSELSISCVATGGRRRG